MHAQKLALLYFIAIGVYAADLAAFNVQRSTETLNDECSIGVSNQSSPQCHVSLVQRRAKALSLASQTEEGCQVWTFKAGPNGNLVGILQGPTTGSGQTEIHSLSQSSNYQSWALQIGTGFGYTSSATWDFAVMSNGDLMGILMGPTSGSGMTEVHILSQSSNYQQFALHAATGLGYTDTPNAEWDFATMPNGDLMGILKGPSTGTGMTEVHILSQSSNYQSFSLQTGTALGYTYNADWDFAVMPNGDLMGILMGPSTGSGMTEVHTLSASSNYQSWVLQVPTALGYTTPADWSFAVLPNGDLMGILKGPTSGTETTEVHIMSQSSNYQNWALQVGTAMGLSAGPSVCPDTPAPTPVPTPAPTPGTTAASSGNSAESVSSLVQSQGGKIYGVGLDGTISLGHWSSMTPSSGWSLLESSCCVTSIFTNSNTMYGVGTDNQIWSKGMNGANLDAGDWTLFGPGCVIAITYHAGTIYGVTCNQSLVSADLHSMTPSSTWTPLGGCCVKSIAISGYTNTLYGVDDNNQVLGKNFSNLTSDWVAFNVGPMPSIAICEHVIYGVGTKGKIYAGDLHTMTTSTEWTLVGPANMTAIWIQCGSGNHNPQPTPAPTPEPTPEPVESSTCKIVGDPHIITFDKTSNSAASFVTHSELSTGAPTDEDASDFWIVKNPHIYIQGRYKLSPKDDGAGTWLRVLAVGGAFLQNNTLKFGNKKNYWNEDEILSTLPSQYHNNLISAKYHADAHLVDVEDGPNTAPGVSVELPMGVKLLVERGGMKNLDIMITVPKKLRNLDGQCGNNNGVSSDDTEGLIAQRMELLVAPEDALIGHPANKLADK